mgnify:CR=1 FL=1
MRKWKNPALFLMGGASYVGLEYLWRGRSHGSMFLAGGTCFLLLGKLNRLKWHPALKCIVGSGVITAVELVTGLLVNRDYSVWDYRGVPLNFLGQICLPYSLLWMPVALGAMLIYGWADKRIDNVCN